MKKYKLLKDLPNLKAGAIGDWNGERLLFRYSEKVGDAYKFYDEDIKNNPEWFQEIKEQEIILCSTAPNTDLTKADILVKNPTPQTRELLNGKTVERWVSDNALKELRNGEHLPSRNVCTRQGVYCPHKIFITFND